MSPPQTLINRFQYAYDFLSNFYPASVYIDGLEFLSSEAAFQAFKCKNIDDRQLFTRLSADEAKRLGRRIVLRPDWEQVKLDVMRRVVRTKFVQHPNLARYLLDTGDAELVEGNTWHDVYWGVDLRTGEGENHLGKILMAQRQEFKDNGLPAPDASLHNYMTFEADAGFRLQLRDITEIECDCIVNAANETLLPSSGVDVAIHRAAGPELQEECRRLGGCGVTGAKLTGGWRLPAKYVIHAVGPHYGVKDDAALLAQTYRNVLDLAAEYDVHSIAFPAISVGTFSYPKKEAADIAVRAIRAWKDDHPGYVLQVILACLDIGVYNAFLETLGQSAADK